MTPKQNRALVPALLCWCAVAWPGLPLHGWQPASQDNFGAASGAEAIAPLHSMSIPPAPYFSPETYLAHVYYLASDELGGRAVGTPGIERAASYIADQFAAAGIAPGGVDGTYFQPFDFDRGARLTDEGRLEISGTDKGKLARGKDYTPFPWSTNDDFSGDVVFVGYGLVNPEKNYDDYAGVDAKGKVVLMLRREPPSWGGGPRGYSPLARFDNKVATARKHGAIAVLIANQRPGEGKKDSLMPFVGGGRQDFGLPAFHLRRAVADRLLAAGGLEPLSALQASLDGDEPQSTSAPLEGISAEGVAGMAASRISTRNVIGVIRGTGSQADEYLVIGAHYDHVGKIRPRSMFGRTASGPPEIHNGADDNASGTAGVIELGKVLAKQRDLQRSVLLVAFTAEEGGLHGSRHFVNNPTVPVDSLVACLNLDMVGRLPEGSKEVPVLGISTATEFDEIVRRAAARADLTVRRAGRGGSDEMSFHYANIPGLFFHTGMHPDYHRPTDDAEKINEQAAVRVLQLVHEVANELIAAEQRPTFVEGDRARSRGPWGQRVVMGIYPDYTASKNTPGLLVKSVVAGGPAQKAGMRNGDRIVRIAGVEIGQISDYIASLADRKPGDKVEVVVLRDDAEVALTIELGSG